MRGMELRRDANGKVVGLAWPTPQRSEKEVKDSYYDAVRAQTQTERRLSNGQSLGGREREEYCQAGLHLMEEHGREIASGGRYCNACKNIRRRKKNSD